MPELKSALYAGKVMHQRLKPRRHRLSYRIFFLLLDLDEIDAVSKRLRLLSHNRFNLFGFADTDHGDGSGESTSGGSSGSDDGGGSGGHEGSGSDNSGSGSDDSGGSGSDNSGSGSDDSGSSGSGSGGHGDD